MLQFAAAVTVLITSANRLFLVGIFFLGLTTSALQFIAIAALADAYPVSGGQKIALSLFWAVMIPSRVLVGRFSAYAKKMLIAAIVLIPVSMLAMSAASAPTVVLLLCIPLGFASGAIYPCVLTMMLPFAGRSTATATGIITSATGVGGVVFTAMTGFLADRYGLRTAMLILVSFFVLSLGSLSGLRTARHPKGQADIRRSPPTLPPRKRSMLYGKKSRYIHQRELSKGNRLPRDPALLSAGDPYGLAAALLL